MAAEIAARTMMDAKLAGRKLAKEHMQEFLPVIAGMAAFHQPTYPGMAQQNPHSNEKQFEKWFGYFLNLARSLAVYESPTFRAIDMRAILPAGQETNPTQVLQAMLDEIDGESRVERQAAKQIEHQAEIIHPERMKKAV